jgi:hypothetical protein
MITAGGAAAYSTPADMARYVAALVGGGANQHGSVLKPDTLATMFEPQYQPDPRIPGIGLAFFRVNAGGHRVVEHQGIMSGFTSQVFVAPDDGVGVLAFTNGTRSGMFWLPTETGRLLNHLLGVPDHAIRTDVPQHPEIWRELCGWYQVAARLTDARVRGMMGAGLEVFVRDGRLWIRFLTPVPMLYRGFRLYPDDDRDPYVFRVDVSRFGWGTLRVVFSREPGTETTAAYLEVSPMTVRKQPAMTNPRLWATGALAAGATAAVVLRGRGRARRRRTS